MSRNCSTPTRTVLLRKTWSLEPADRTTSSKERRTDGSRSAWRVERCGMKRTMLVPGARAGQSGAYSANVCERDRNRAPRARHLHFRRRRREPGEGNRAKDGQQGQRRVCALTSNERERPERDVLSATAPVPDTHDAEGGARALDRR